MRSARARKLRLARRRECERSHTHIHTHTHPFNGPFSGTTGVSQYQKGKINLDFTEARDSTLPLSFLQAGCPSCRPTNSVKALKAIYANEDVYNHGKRAWRCEDGSGDGYACYTNPRTHSLSRNYREFGPHHRGRSLTGELSLSCARPAADG